MNIPRQSRALTAWALYASVLFSLLICGLHHGQMSGLELVHRYCRNLTEL